MIKPYCAYVRVSTQRQGENGVSLQAQRDAISRYATEHGLSVVAWFEERQTAAIEGRPVFNQMVTALRSGAMRGVVIYKVSRSARNLKDWVDLGNLIDSGIDVRFASEGLDVQTRSGRLAADIQAVIAADYIRSLREETTQGFYGRIKQGLYPLPAPLGYLDMGGGKPKVIDPAAGPMIRVAFGLYTSGEYSLSSLARRMVELGAQTKRGMPVSGHAWSRILRNPFYVGEIKLASSGTVFPGRHEPLVARALFDRVQQLLRRRQRRKDSRHEFRFRRMIHCLGCERSLIGEFQKGHTYYRCHTSACETACFREETLANALNQKLATILPGAGPIALTIYEATTPAEQRLILNHLHCQFMVRGKWFDVRLDGLDGRNSEEMQEFQRIVQGLAARLTLQRVKRAPIQETP